MEGKTVTELIEQVREEMCNSYCKYTDESHKYLDQEEVYEYCKECPLNKL